MATMAIDKGMPIEQSTKIIRVYKNRYYNGICYGKSK